MKRKQAEKPVKGELTLKDLRSVVGGLWLPVYNARRKRVIVTVTTTALP